MSHGERPGRVLILSYLDPQARDWVRYTCSDRTRNAWLLRGIHGIGDAERAVETIGLPVAVARKSHYDYQTQREDLTQAVQLIASFALTKWSPVYAFLR